ncbi:hypothetical protein PTKIN_Ptkin12aG0011500 [Pterospermum kingtungense]
MATEAKEVHAVMFPHFAFGHISPFIQLSNKLCRHGVKISFLTAAGNVSRIKSSFPLDPNIQIIPLEIQGLPPHLHNTSEMTPVMHELLKQALDLMQPQVKTVLSGLRPQFVFYDFVQTWLPKLCSQLGIKPLRFSVFSAISVAYLMDPARLSGVDQSDKLLSVDDLMKPPHGFPETSSVTSLQAFQAQNLLSIFKSFDGGPPVYNRVMECFAGCNAMVIKTCNEMEAPYVDFLRNQLQKKVLLSGPLTPDPPSGVLEEKWAHWLGQHRAKSVIFCSFGSETFLNGDQINELAIGLELTGFPFFLVLNFPTNGRAELDRVLPKGFTEKIKGRGVVHTGWVQQQLILAHDSVGCFVCHSGFSSVIEAFVNDCQLVLLPLKGDQFLNSKLIAGDLKAAVEVSRRDEDGYFSKESIKDAVNTVMVEVDNNPGMSIRENHKKLKEFLLNAQRQDMFISDLVEEMKTMA